jgi:L-asparaginase II
MKPDNGYRPLVKVWRGEIVESVHHGAVALADDSGRIVSRHGDPGIVTYLRSAAKPAQILPLLASGAADRFGFSEAEIAIMIGSHGGEPFHVETVRSILARLGLDEEALQCGAHPPYHKPSARALRQAHQQPGALHNNCSGKHAGMLALAVHLGAPVETYLEESHPVQQRIRGAIATLTGVAPGAIVTATDGCSAPNFAVPLGAAAALFARLVAPHALPADLREAAGRATRAMRRHPEMVAGTERLCTALMQAGSHGLIAKIGAEGFYGLGYTRDGRGYGLALKVADGDGERARPTAVIAALRAVDVIDEATAADLLERFVGPLRNHRGIVVGRVGSCLDLRPAS